MQEPTNKEEVLNTEVKLDMRLKENKVNKESIEQKLDKVLDLLEKIVKQPAFIQPQAQPIQNKPVETNFDPTNYVPNEYREIVTQVLSKDFGIEVSPLSDSPAFQFTIICPDKYSTITPEHKAMYGKDIRPKVITNGEGSIGVRAWAERVWMSFNPTIQALIVSDRTK